MDSKSAGVAEAVAQLSVVDEELRKAAERLKRNREEELSIARRKNEPSAKPKLIDESPSSKDTTKPVSEETKPKTRPKKPSCLTLPKEWGVPTATLNTRVPTEMDQLLDELLAKKRRDWKLGGQKGVKPTKQSIVQHALDTYFKSQIKK